MDVVALQTPHLARRVDALRREHDQFRQTVSHLVPRLERVAPPDRAEFDKLCGELLGFVARLDEHGRKEAALLHEAFARDGGGEG
jgi:hypothetical protein